MEYLINSAQIIVAVSVVFVWTFRYHNVLKEFELFGLSDLIRNLVGAAKISLATLLVVGVWYPSFVLIPAILMGLFMLGSQYFHYKIRNPFIRHLPSMTFLSLCAFILYFSIY